MGVVVAGWIVRVLLAVVFVGMGIAHFAPASAAGMRAAIPPTLRRPGLPSPAALVAVTGVCELAGAVGLLVPWTRPIAAVALVTFLVAVFPANAYMARHPEGFGRFAVPLVPRLLAQIALGALVLVAGFAPA